MDEFDQEPGKPDIDAISIDVGLPDAAARARAANYGKKPMAEVAVELDDGTVYRIVVPVRVGRLLDDAAVALPQSWHDAFDAIHELEYRVCVAQLTDLLSRRDYAEGELRRKLKTYGYRDQEIERALEYGRDHRFVDDLRFAEYFIAERVRRGWGKRRVELELQRRGIDVDAIEGYPERFFNDEDDLARARKILASRPVPTTRAHEKFIRHLVSRGFSYAIAREAASSVLSD